MKTINPFDDLQTSYTKENLIRYIDANNYLEKSFSNNKNLLNIFEESEKVLGYVISPAYLVHYCLFIRNMVMNTCLNKILFNKDLLNNSQVGSNDPDFIINEVYSNYEAFLLLKKIKIDKNTSDVKIYDVFVLFNDNKLTKETITSFLSENMSYFKESYCILNIIKADKFLNKGLKNLTLLQFKDLEILLATMKKTLPTFFKMSQQDLFFRSITKELKDIHEQLCIFAQNAIAISSNEIKENLLKDILNNGEVDKIINPNKEPLNIEKIAKALSPSDKINNINVIKELVMEEKFITNILYSFEIIALELFPEKKFEVNYIDDDDVLITHLVLKEKNTSKERIFFNITEDMIQSQYRKKINKRVLNKKENKKNDDKHDRKQ